MPQRDMPSQNSAYSYNESAYRRLGFGAQRKYPNEEFCRFMGRNYFGVEPSLRKSTRILEVGCGSASNLWMVAKEGFDAYGIDYSPAALPLAEAMLKMHGVKARLAVGDMTDLSFQNGYFDAVVDVFSSFCLDENGFRRMLSESARVLKPDGRFFIYTPGKGSDAWKDFLPSSKIDGSTLDGISRPSSAYYPSPCTFRFITHTELEQELRACNLTSGTCRDGYSHLSIRPGNIRVRSRRGEEVWGKLGLTPHFLLLMREGSSPEGRDAGSGREARRARPPERRTRQTSAKKSCKTLQPPVKSPARLEDIVQSRWIECLFRLRSSSRRPIAPARRKSW